jgi:hypothetical protein
MGEGFRSLPRKQIKLLASRSRKAKNHPDGWFCANGSGGRDRTYDQSLTFYSLFLVAWTISSSLKIMSRMWGVSRPIKSESTLFRDSL